MPFPARRPRRLRRTETLRRSLGETRLHVEQFIAPLFVIAGRRQRKPIASLPGQSRHVGNLALSYEKGGFSGRVALNFHGRYMSEVGDEAAEDVFYDDRVQLDLAASHRIARGLRLFLEVNNLTNEPLRCYVGVPDRPIQEEYYRWWGTVGLKWDF